MNEIDGKKSALLFFDMIKGFYDEVAAAKKARLKPIVDNAARLMKAGREAGMPIFFARGTHRADGSTSTQLLTDTDNSLAPWSHGVVTKRRVPVSLEGRTSSEIITELESRPDDYYISKYRWNAFHQTYFDLALRSKGVDTIVICGASTEMGVAATVYGARDLDYNVIIVSDACTSLHNERVHDMFIEFVFPRMCRVRGTQQTLNMIREATQKAARFESAETHEESIFKSDR
ncbi:MAG: cysteine hydrolase [Candidatus Binatia bacterium]